MKIQLTADWTEFLRLLTSHRVLDVEADSGGGDGDTSCVLSAKWK
jgi:hypothetical protein